MVPRRGFAATALLLALAAAACQSTPPCHAVAEEPSPPEEKSDLLGTIEEIADEYLRAPPMVMGDLGDTVPLAANAPRRPTEDETAGRQIGKLRAVPIPLASKMIGVGIGLGVGYVFDPDGNQRPQVPSVLGLGGFVSSRGSWALAGGVRAFVDDARWLVTSGAGVSRLRYDFHGVGAENGLDDDSRPVEEKTVGFRAEVLRRIGESFYFGPRYVFQKTRASFRDEDSDLPEHEEFDALSSSLGFRLLWDDRDEASFPRSGFLVNATADFNGHGLGSDFVYQLYFLAANSYFGLGDENVLAVRAQGRFAHGDVPFHDLSLYGKLSDLRGYTVGRWRDRLMTTLQAEYRHHLNAAWMAIGFAGIGKLAPGLGTWTSDEFLPSVGAGIRYRYGGAAGVVYRLDGAYSREGFSILLGIGQSF